METTSGFSFAHSLSTSSFESMENNTDIDESAEEGEEEVVYEVKCAQTHNVEIQKGMLLSWRPGGVQGMLTGPITTTLETASSSVAVEIDDFPIVSVDAFKNADDEIGELASRPSTPLKAHAPLPAPILDERNTVFIGMVRARHQPGCICLWRRLDNDRDDFIPLSRLAR
ncbi:hypothetical protein MVEN_01722400 [Mycena venus]|uniref:Uncharacterized protein n=1 Tax=Mycena venus TaxID=2733690 RepID=A0A8H7CNZ6_9AGAR|nr:hypothetical protein MVEN_01722400 [Mycena venus]